MLVRLLFEEVLRRHPWDLDAVSRVTMAFQVRPLVWVLPETIVEIMDILLPLQYNEIIAVTTACLPLWNQHCQTCMDLAIERHEMVLHQYMAVGMATAEDHQAVVTLLKLPRHRTVQAVVEITMLEAHHVHLDTVLRLTAAIITPTMEGTITQLQIAIPLLTMDIAVQEATTLAPEVVTTTRAEVMDILMGVMTRLEALDTHHTIMATHHHMDSRAVGGLAQDSSNSSNNNNNKVHGGIIDLLAAKFFSAGLTFISLFSRHYLNSATCTAPPAGDFIAIIFPCHLHSEGAGTQLRNSFLDMYSNLDFTTDTWFWDAISPRITRFKFDKRIILKSSWSKQRKILIQL